MALVAAYPLDSAAVRCVRGAHHAPDALLLAVQVGSVASFVFVAVMMALVRFRWAAVVGAVAITLTLLTYLAYAERVSCG